MRIEDGFRVDVPVEQSWPVLLDIERIAACLPGAELRSAEGGEFRGVVHVKLGSMRAEYEGTARFEDIVEDERRIVVRAEGTEVHGQGRASATVTATLTPDGGGTAVAVVTDLNITGPVAQFGRGVIQSVSSTLMREFVADLERELLAGTRPLPAEGPSRTSASDTPTSAKQPVDLLRVAARPVLVRVAAATLAVAGIALVVWYLA